MAIDWKLLVHVREQQRLVASQALAQERELAVQREAQVRRAEGELAQQIDAKARLWQAAAAPGVGLDMATLRDASAWSRALDGHIAQATGRLRMAEQGGQAQQQRVDQSAAELKAACGNVVKAEEMQTRVEAAVRRQRDVRAEEPAEEHAARLWLARRAC